jgi:hypothetical protein
MPKHSPCTRALLIRPDGFVLGLVGTIVTATLLPCKGSGAHSWHRSDRIIVFLAGRSLAPRRTAPRTHDKFRLPLSLSAECNMTVYLVDAVVCLCPRCGGIEFLPNAGPGLDPAITCAGCGHETTIGNALRTAGGSFWTEVEPLESDSQAA